MTSNSTQSNSANDDADITKTSTSKGAAQSEAYLAGHQPVGLTSIGLAILTAALWGGTPVAIKFSVGQIPPVLVAAIRFALAALFMVVWCRIERTEMRLRAGQIVPVLIGGLLLFMQISLFNFGVASSNASHSSVLINTFVIWVALIEHFLLQTDRLNLRKVFGLTLAISGGILLTTMAEHEPGESWAKPTLFGDSLLIASALLLGIKIAFTKHSIKTVEPGKFILWHDVIGVVLFLAYSVLMEPFPNEAIETSTIIGLLYQGVLVAGLCFAVQARLLQRHGASQISVFSCSTPVFGILFAVVFIGDALSPWLFVAGTCVAIGILIVTTANRPPRLQG
ncbi:MAG: DMT family transporter [Planctomycetota bacterium]|nr:DMT family transporter [Planctomycetota bacterium]